MRSLPIEHYSKLLLVTFEQWRADTSVNLLNTINLVTEDATPEEIVDITADFLKQFHELYKKYYDKEPKGRACLLLELANNLVLQLAKSSFPIKRLRAYGERFSDPCACETDELYSTYMKNLSNLSSGPENISTEFIRHYEDFYHKLNNSSSLEDNKSIINAIFISNTVKLFNIHRIIGNKLFDTDISATELLDYLSSYKPIEEKYIFAMSLLNKNAKNLDESANSLTKFALYLDLYDKLAAVKFLGEFRAMTINFNEDKCKKPLSFHEKLEALVKSKATMRNIEDFLLDSIHEAYDKALNNSTIKTLAENKPLEKYECLHAHHMKEVLADVNYNLIVTMLAIKMHLSEQQVKKIHQESLDNAKYLNRESFFNKPRELSKPVNDSEVSHEKNFGMFMNKIMGV